jgi:uncharacterized protein YdeI (BOF family)
MKYVSVLLASALLASPALAQAQTGQGADSDKPARTDVVKVPRGSVATSTHNVNDTDRLIDEEQKRIDRMMAICTGC